MIEKLEQLYDSYFKADAYGTMEDFNNAEVALAEEKQRIVNRIAELEEAERILNALYRGGVDNWSNGKVNRWRIWNDS